MRIEFVPIEVGTHIIEASIDGTKLAGGPLIAKVYDSSLIQVTDVNGGVVGQPCQFRGIYNIDMYLQYLFYSIKCYWQSLFIYVFFIHIQLYILT